MCDSSRSALVKGTCLSSVPPTTDHVVSDSPIASLERMPAEILHEVAGYLLHGLAQPDTRTWMLKTATRSMKTRLQKRRNVMSLSACCKRLRKALFGQWIRNALAVQSSQDDLDMVNSLSNEMRAFVTYLLIRQDHTDAAAMKTLVMAFRPAEDAARIQEQFNVSAFGKDQSPQQETPNSAFTDLTIQARDSEDFKVTDEEKISQLGWILQGIVCPRLQGLSVQCRSFDEMHMESSSANWSRLAEVLQGCRHPCLDRLHVVFHMEMNGHAIDKDLCLAWQELLRTCWKQSPINEVTICLSFRGEPGDSYKYWAPFSFDPREITLYPTVFPPSDKILGLLQTVREHKPELKKFTYHIECGIWAQDHESIMNVAMLNPKFPQEQPIYDNHDDDDAHDNGMRMTTRHPILDDIANLMVSCKSVHQMCPMPTEIWNMLVAEAEEEANILNEMEEDADLTEDESS